MEQVLIFIFFVVDLVLMFVVLPVSVIFVALRSLNSVFLLAYAGDTLISSILLNYRNPQMEWKDIMSIASERLIECLEKTGA